MNDDLEMLPEAERSRMRSRDRKVTGPRVVVDNRGLRKVAMGVAERLRKRPAGPDPTVGKRGSPGKPR